MGLFGPSALEVIRAYQAGCDSYRRESAAAEAKREDLVDYPKPPTTSRDECRAWELGFEDARLSSREAHRLAGKEFPCATRIPLTYRFEGA